MKTKLEEIQEWINTTNNDLREIENEGKTLTSKRNEERGKKIQEKMTNI